MTILHAGKRVRIDDHGKAWEIVWLVYRRQRRRQILRHEWQAAKEILRDFTREMDFMFTL